MMTEIRADVATATAAPWARTISLVAAGAISLALMLDPYLLRSFSLSRIHEGLPFLLLGVAGAFVHGFGYRATSGITRALAHPMLSWLLLGFGAAWIAMR
jgi:predicted membrane protein